MFIPPDSARVRNHALQLTLAAWLLLQPGCSNGHGKSPSDAGKDDAIARPASCEPIGKSVACTGRGGCAGSQVCEESGRYGACDCGDGFTDPSGPSAEAGAGAGSDAGPMTAMCGAACTSASDCGGGSCIKELSGMSTVQGLGTLQRKRFPGGMCSQVPLTDVDSAAACDPEAPLGSQGCGGCGVCDYVLFADALASVCRERCTPSVTDNGCSRDEYTCSFDAHSCVEGECSNDDECRVYTEDTDDDGQPDALVYDKASAASCDMVTRRCHVDGKAGAQAGDPCLRDDDCEADGNCLTETAGGFELPFLGGYCLKDGCDVPGLACAGDGVCSIPRAWFEEESLGKVCTHRCEVGKEPTADQLGAAGHAAGCRTGYMCIANGLSGDARGTCVPGNYNAITTNNVGALCKNTSECYSPFGHGRCVAMGSDLASASFCTVFDCGTPGLPSSVCGTGNLCALLGDLPTCLRSCTDATQCAAGLACQSIGQNVRGCVFGCEADSECKPDEKCSTRTGECVKSATVARDI